MHISRSVTALEQQPAGTSTGPGALIRRFRSEILAMWQDAVRELPRARGLSTPLLVDHVPGVLEEIADVADRFGAGESVELPMTGEHALNRIQEGFNVGELVAELALLRRCISAVAERERAEPSLAALRAIGEAVDRAIGFSVARYVEAREQAAMTFQHDLEQLGVDRERTLAKLESLLAGAPLGLAFVDNELRYLRINDALAAFNGKPAAEHIGRTVREVIPEHADQLEQLLVNVRDTGCPVLDVPITQVGRTAADTRYLSANYFPVRSGDTVIGVGGIVLDVTATKRTDQALQEQKALLQSIVEHAPAAIWVKDSTGRIVLANHRLADALAQPWEQLLGHRSDELLPANFAQQHLEHDRVVFDENRAIEVEEVAPGPDGVRTFLSIKFPIPADPPLIGGIATEITDRKRMEQDLRVAVRTREDMMAVVGHDLRSPLGTVQLSATLLMSQLASDARTRKHLDIIQRACTRIENLIDDLLDTASIRAGRFQIDLRTEPIDEVATEALELQRPLAEERGIALARVCELPGVRVRCDRHRILQVFGNLIGNALKFCRAGDTITVRGERAGNSVRFSVIDTGPGIEPDVLPNLFEPYWSGPGHTRIGAGLGLYIVRGIIEAHGGQITVESTPGSGTTFAFTLPIESASAH